MPTKFAAVTTAMLAAATALAPAADAAGGVRLGFGGPLGTFTATPSKGAASRAAHHPRVKQAMPKPRASAHLREAAKKSEKPARIVSSERAPRAAHNTEAPREIIAKADIAGDRVAPLTGSSALIQSALPDTEAQEMTVQTGTEATADAPVERNATADAEATEAPPAQEAARGTATCSKFIPAVGMTVTVACDE
ncbi:hypothetical protein [Hyphomicrobium sp.]|uniref:hypothetical protein n=1 Tax=Hyphomicrobium sp. TaxID=82 RepID=UPI002BB9F5CA|nr:hypothetical protein [Hyphomicrobium sp.]HRN88481.1 hypothetical protein [Hyphomicrobium sp.]HRQ25558.1 hypothetical protein [Hyphomicrobium sp.]